MTAGGYLLYGELAGWWPLISPPEAYAAEAAELAALLRGAAAPGPGPLRVLDLGCGGGHLAAHLSAAGLELTGVDISAPMLTVSAALNPGAEHILGDMRTIRLHRRFDAVLAHDAVSYMTTRADLAAAIGTAWAHCRPGGIAVFVPEHTAETFAPGAGAGGGAGPDGRSARFRSWSADPDPADDWIQTDYEITLRAADGTESAWRESHRLSAMPAATWLDMLTAAGFTARAQPARASSAAVLFVASRPVTPQGPVFVTQ